jgi:ribosome-associated protein
MALIVVTPGIAIQESELDESFVLSTGPGGQNVNKLATAVQLRFDVAHSSSLPDAVRTRLMRLAGSRLTKEGVLVLTAREYRSQERNREAARTRLIELIRHAAVEPKPRKKTRPPKAAKERRLDAKSRRGKLKRGRSRVPDE